MFVVALVSVVIWIPSIPVKLLLGVFVVFSGKMFSATTDSF